MIRIKHNLPLASFYSVMYFASMAEANGLPGLYVVFDSIIGGGKGAQISELKQKLPLDFPTLDITFTYEPGGTPEADRLRQKLKFENMSPEEEMHLFAKSRSITIPQVVEPALVRGGIDNIR